MRLLSYEITLQVQITNFRNRPRGQTRIGEFFLFAKNEKTPPCTAKIVGKNSYARLG